jgi:Zn-finger nucleic acid-binding protein
MNCPRGHGAFQERTIGPVRLDVCQECRGIWYDIDELRVLKDRESHGDYRWIDVDLWKDPGDFRAAKQRNLPCPKDSEILVTMRYGETNVEVNACPKCHGIWLENGDYEAIIGALDKRVNTQSLRDYAGDLREEFLEVLTGDEGFASEWQDMDRVLYLMELRFAAERPGLTTILNSVRI